MSTIEAIRRRIKSTQDLQSVVKTMKALAAANIWQYERAVASLIDYNRTIELGLQITLSNRSAAVKIAAPTVSQKLGAIVMGSDQGMVGRFNEQIGSFTIDKMNELHIPHKDRSLLTIGARLTAYLQAAHQPIEDYFSMPGSIAGITSTVQEILLWLEEWREEKELEQILIFHNKPLPNSSAYRPYMTKLLPIDLNWLQRLQEKPWPTKVIPLFTMDWERLFSALIRQYFFVAVYRAFAESLASENVSRLASMQAAEKNIEDQLDELDAQFHQVRQKAITEELLDIVSGFEALSKPN